MLLPPTFSLATPLPLIPLNMAPLHIGLLVYPLSLLYLTLCEQIEVPNPDTELEVIRDNLGLSIRRPVPAAVISLLLADTGYERSDR